MFCQKGVCGCWGQKRWGKLENKREMVNLEMRDDCAMELGR